MVGRSRSKIGCLYVVAVLGLSSVPSLASSPPHRCRSLVLAPSQGNAQAALLGVTAVSVNSAWAVGWTNEAPNDYVARVEHWIAGSWTSVRTPAISGGVILNAVTHTSPSDIWAAGFSPGTGRALVERWDGRTWTQAQNPEVGSSVFWGMSGTSRTDVWAVGERRQGRKKTTLAEHWDGREWSVFSTTTPGSSAALLSVTVISRKDAWAVGYYLGGRGTSHPLVERWDGTRWRLHRIDADLTSPASLFGVASSSTRDAWAVGYQTIGSTTKAGALHWNGSKWHLVPSPLGQSSGLFAVSDESPNDAWGVGAVLVGNEEKTLALNWDGQHWRRVNSENVSSPTTNNALLSVDASGNHVWAVGSLIRGGFEVRIRPLREESSTACS
jgi:hypothetical protein